MFSSRLPDLVSLVCLLVRAQHTKVLKYAWLPHTLTLTQVVDRVTLVYSHPPDSHFCHYVQMDNTGSTSADVESWTLVNYLEEGGFPALLWDTLKDFG
jgi:hypothetical protein